MENPKTDFPPWTGPEAVRRLNVEIPPGKARYLYGLGAAQAPEVRALQQLMVDAGLPEPVDEAEELLLDLACLESGDKRAALRTIRAALAKARGERHG